MGKYKIKYIPLILLKACANIPAKSAEIIVCLSKRSVDPAYRGPVGSADRTGVPVCVELAWSTCLGETIAKTEASCDVSGRSYNNEVRSLVCG